MSTELLQYFKYTHLPERLQKISEPFSELAHFCALHLPYGNSETEAALRKLLEAKDCAVRAAL